MKTTDEMLKAVDGVLARKVRAILKDMKSLGHEMCITEGYRTIARQKRLYAQGRTKPGPIVTWTLKSKHCDGKAADCCFVIDGKPSWDGGLPWHIYGEHAEKRGLRWLGHIGDKCHVELP